MVLWTAGFVLLTLVINAPMLPYVLRWTGLNKGAFLTLMPGAPVAVECTKWACKATAVFRLRRH